MVKYDDKERDSLLDLWNKAEINKDKLNEVKVQVVDHLVKNKARYEAVSAKTNVPWFVIGCIHFMESDSNFKTHLHNGDVLTARTIQVPAGRPVAGNPPFTWEESAIDALGYDHFVGEKDWSIPHILFMLESYNGFGYRNRGVPSAYVWSGTNVQKPGRFTKDGADGWDPDSMSTRCGCAAMLKELISTGWIQNGNVDPLPGSSSVPVPNPAPAPIEPNKREIVRWVINSNSANDMRGYDANGKVVCWLDTEKSLEKMYYGAMMAGAPRAPFSIESMDKKPSKTPPPFPIPPEKTNAQRFVEHFKNNYQDVRAMIESWFTPAYSPNAVKNACVAHIVSNLVLCKLPAPKLGTTASINVDVFRDWTLAHGWQKITDLTKLQAGDICVSGPSQTDIDHIFCFVSFKDKDTAFVLHNQAVGVAERALRGGPCGESRFALRMPK